MSVFRIELSSPAPDGRQSAAARAVCVGTRRYLSQLGLASVTELTLSSGRRADIAALSASGEIWIVEIKSSPVDFRTDRKWERYRDFCDRLWFAVPQTFPVAILPPDTGLIIADGYGAMAMREAPIHPLAGARRKAVTLLFAHDAARRLHALADPGGASGRLDTL